MDVDKDLAHPVADELPAQARGSIIKPSRRNILKVAAAGVVGAGFAAAGIKPALGAPPAPPPVGTPYTPTNRAVGGGPVPSSRVVATGTIEYRAYTGEDFIPIESAMGWAHASGGFTYPTSSLGFFNKALEIPSGALIQYVAAYCLMNDANGMSFSMYSFDGTGGANQIASTTFSVASATQQYKLLTIPTPITINNFANAYSLLAFPESTGGATQQIRGMQVAYSLVPGLTTFPSGHRVFDGYATPVSNGNVYGPINALVEVSTSGWTGQLTGVPAGAKAAWCAVQAYSPGVLTLFPDGAADPGGANYAGTGPNGQLNLLYQLVPLSAAGKFKIHAYFTGQVFVDVWGYQV